MAEGGKVVAPLVMTPSAISSFLRYALHFAHVSIMERALFVFVNGLLPKTFLFTKSIADSVRGEI